MGRAGVGGDDQSGGIEDGQQLLETGLADQVDRLVFAQAADFPAVVLFDFGRAAGQDYGEVMFLHGVVCHGGIALDGPVAIGLAGAWADHQVRLVRQPAVHLLADFLRNRNIPAQIPFLDAECFGKAEQAVHDVLAFTGGDLVVGEQPLQVFGAGPVEAEPDIGRDQQAGQTGAQGHLHVQQDIEMAAAHLLSQLPIGLQARLFVKDDKLDAGNVTDQGMFQLADDPGQPGMGPGLLQGADHRQGMTDIPHR